MSLTQWLLLPAFVQVALTFAVGVRMGRARFRAARAGRVKVSEVAVDSGKWPEDVRKIANNYQNQFEVPVLYFALLPLLLATGKVDGASVILSWAFVASRVAHSIVHLGANVVLTRFRLFVLGFAIVALMWAWFGLRLYVIG